MGALPGASGTGVHATRVREANRHQRAPWKAGHARGHGPVNGACGPGRSPFPPAWQFESDQTLPASRPLRGTGLGGEQVVRSGNPSLLNERGRFRWGHCDRPHDLTAPRHQLLSTRDGLGGLARLEVL